MSLNSQIHLPLVSILPYYHTDHTDRSTLINHNYNQDSVVGHVKRFRLIFTENFTFSGYSLPQATVSATRFYPHHLPDVRKYCGQQENK